MGSYPDVYAVKCIECDEWTDSDSALFDGNNYTCQWCGDITSHILDVISDLISGFLYYDRKEDEDLPRGRIEKAVKDGTITIEDMVRAFEADLKKGLGYEKTNISDGA